VIWQGSTDN